MKIWKRNAVVAAAVLLVGAAVYLNWSMNQADPVDGAYEQFETEQTQQQAETAGETTQLQPSADEETMSSAGTVESEEAGYFAQARLSRQQARDSALALLNDAADRETAGEEESRELVQAVGAIAQHALQEVRIENLVKAKGFADCVAFIGEDGLRIVVSAPASGLNQTDVAKIRDVAQSETSLSSGEIRIIEVPAGADSTVPNEESDA